MTKVYFYYITAIIFSIIIGYFGWRIGRVINYNLSYKSMVIQTIKENVKPEYLKEVEP